MATAFNVDGAGKFANSAVTSPNRGVFNYDNQRIKDSNHEEKSRYVSDEAEGKGRIGDVDIADTASNISPGGHRDIMSNTQRPSNTSRNVSGFLPPAISVAAKYGMIHPQQASPQEQADTKIYEFMQEVEKNLFAP
jgi:hypothetical protein